MMYKVAPLIAIRKVQEMGWDRGSSINELLESVCESSMNAFSFGLTCM